MACQICNFEIAVDGLCTFHREEYMPCMKCTTLVKRAAKYCEVCLGDSYGRCYDCGALMKTREDFHLVKAPRQGAIGHYLCTRCHMDYAPLSYLNLATLPDVVVKWPSVTVEPLARFALGEGARPLIRLNSDSAKTNLCLARFAEKMNQWPTQILLTTYPMPEGYANWLDKSYLRTFYGGAPAEQFVLTQPTIFLPPNVAGGVYPAVTLSPAGWPRQIALWVENRNVKYDQEVGKAKWSPASSDEQSRTVFMPESLIDLLYKNLLRSKAEGINVKTPVPTELTSQGLERALRELREALT